MKDKIEVGVSLGIQKSEKAMLQEIEGYLKAIRKKFPTIPLMADANCA